MVGVSERTLTPTLFISSIASLGRPNLTAFCFQDSDRASIMVKVRQPFALASRHAEERD